MSHNPISQLLLERYILGEVTKEERQQVETAIKDDPTLQIRIKELREESRQILSDYPPRITALAIEEKSQGAPARRSAWVLGLSSAVVTAAALLIVVNSGLLDTPQAPTNEPARATRQAVEQLSPETTRAKGDSRLMVHLQQGDDSVELADGDVAHPGDVIQVKYLAADASHGVIFSVDGHGAVTLHYPETEDGDTTLDRRGAQALKRAYELDDAPDFERFFFVVGQEPIEVGRLLDAAEALGTAAGEGVALPGDWAAVSVLLRKEGLE